VVACCVAAAGLTVDDLTADLPTIREQVARATYGDAFMDALHRDHAAQRGTDGGPGS